MDLKNIISIHGRAEELGRDKSYREKYDIAISRAVASLNTLSWILFAFCKGRRIFYFDERIRCGWGIKRSKKSIKILGGKLKEKKVIKLPLSDITHSLIIIEKIKETPTKYPRGGGKPKKKPL